MLSLHLCHHTFSVSVPSILICVSLSLLILPRQWKCDSLLNFWSTCSLYIFTLFEILYVAFLTHMWHLVFCLQIILLRLYWQNLLYGMIHLPNSRVRILIFGVLVIFLPRPKQWSILCNFFLLCLLLCHAYVYTHLWVHTILLGVRY